MGEMSQGASRGHLRIPIAAAARILAAVQTASFIYTHHHGLPTCRWHSIFDACAQYLRILPPAASACVGAFRWDLTHREYRTTHVLVSSSHQAAYALTTVSYQEIDSEGSKQQEWTTSVWGLFRHVYFGSTWTASNSGRPSKLRILQSILQRILRR